MFDVWYHPSGGNVYQLKDFKVDGPHLTIVMTPATDSRLVAHAPAQVNGLEPCTMLLAQRSQLRKHLALKRIALLFQVLKRRTDEDAGGAGGDGHGIGSNKR